VPWASPLAPRASTGLCALRPGKSVLWNLSFHGGCAPASRGGTFVHRLRIPHAPPALCLIRVWPTRSKVSWSLWPFCPCNELENELVCRDVSVSGYKTSCPFVSVFDTLCCDCCCPSLPALGGLRWLC